MKKYIKQHLLNVVEAYETIFLIAPIPFALLAVIIATCLNIILLPINIVYIIGSSIYRVNYDKKWRDGGF